ncbi:unnamed protein product [Callosobruchus maculatus]|uniref:Uncharacterized protein n=1 Tax=Callosobruchus maculatus TaxID=64391 RepID=A0A653BYG4_CALMS|nr:unnamed protein product [Callosobruchus maculatus]
MAVKTLKMTNAPGRPGIPTAYEDAEKIPCMRLAECPTAIARERDDSLVSKIPVIFDQHYTVKKFRKPIFSSLSPVSRKSGNGEMLKFQ